MSFYQPSVLTTYEYFFLITSETQLFIKRGLETIYLIIDAYSGWGCKAGWGRDAAVELQGRIDRVACNPSRNTTVTTG